MEHGQTLIADRAHPLTSDVEELLTVSTDEQQIEVDYRLFSDGMSPPIAREFVTLPWRVAVEIAQAVAQRESELAGR